MRIFKVTLIKCYWLLFRLLSISCPFLVVVHFSKIYHAKFCCNGQKRSSSVPEFNHPFCSVVKIFYEVIDAQIKCFCLLLQKKVDIQYSDAECVKIDAASKKVYCQSNANAKLNVKEEFVVDLD